MGKTTGFLEWERHAPTRRPVELRLRDWSEVYLDQPAEITREQAGRCMDCGIPFCHQACPLGNLIPEWNDQVYRDDYLEALERLHATNNFPEFTGRLCPAPCESACVLNLSENPVTIERIEYEIIERAYRENRIGPRPAINRSGRSVAVVGSGPAGLAAAQQLARAGHDVVVYERHSAIGGLLRFGIPEFKMEKSVLDRRLDQMTAEGVTFRPGVEIGRTITLADLRSQFDAVVLALGSTRPRELVVPGRDLAGIVPAMEYLTASNVAALNQAPMPDDLSATDRHVVILGGGDTGADCLGTAHRQRAASVTQLEIMPRPPEHRPATQPWPTMPLLYKVTSAHEEGGEREYSAETVGFLGDSSGRVRSLQLRRFGDENAPVREIPAELVLIAAGFVGPETSWCSELATTARDTFAVNDQWRCVTTDDGAAVFACGDAVRGQSLIVWAIAEGRSAAAAVDRYLGGDSELPAPLRPYQTLWDL